MRRWVEAAVASIGLVVLAPLLASIAISIKREDGGPILYRARRVGRNGELFDLYKFRTMRPDADRTGPGITTRSDSRVTGIGRWLRRRKIDELPQLINVVKGEMGFVGPRPEDPRYVARYTTRQRRILQKRPGMTSAASVQFRNEEELLGGDDWEDVYCNEVLPAKLRIDLDYQSKRTLGSDVTLILESIRGMM